MKKYIIAILLIAVPWVLNAAVTVGDLTNDCLYDANPKTGALITTCNNSYNPLPKGATGQ